MKLEHFQGEFCEPRFCGRFNPQTGQREAPVTYRPDGWVVKANPNLFRNSEVTMQDRLSSFAGRYPQLFSVIKQGEQQLIRQGARSVSIDVMSEMAEAFDPLLKELMGFSEFLRVSIK
jgi:hypothetical protein